MVTELSNYKDILCNKKMDRLNRLKIKNFNGNITDEELEEMDNIFEWIRKYS